MHEFRNIALLLSIFIPLNWIVIFLFNSKVKSVAKNHLTILFVLATFVFIMAYAKFNCYIEFYTSLFPLQAFAVPMLFPMFYLYVYILTSEHLSYNFYYYLNFIVPILISLGYFFISKIWMNSEEELLYMQNILKSVCLPGQKFQFGYYFYRIAKLVYLGLSIVYFILILQNFRVFKQKIFDYFPDNPSKELSWLRVISVLFIALVLFNAIIHYIRNNYIAINDMLVGISYLIFSFFFWVLGYYGDKQTEIFEQEDVKKTQTFETEKKLSKSDFEQYMINDKPYLYKDLSIFDFCYKFQSNRTYISTFINRNFNMNFKTFINSYRIESAKEIIKEVKLSNSSPYFDQIAINSGFSTYGSFLRVFKVMEGITPTEYYKKLIN